MLQHWDELRMVVPNRVPAVGAGGVGRRYTEQHVRMAMVVGRLRKLPLSLANIKYMLRGVVLDKPLAVYMPGKRQGLLGTVRAIAEADVTRVLCASERGGLLIDLQH
jgi:DNA-binding transcriptional MerR regulator